MVNGVGCGIRPTVHPTSNPAESQALRPAEDEVEERSNPLHALPRGAGVNRMLQRGGIAQEANALGKAQGYADVGTVVWMVERLSGIHAMAVIDSWDSLPWFLLEQDLFRLQKRIYQASLTRCG